DGQFAGGNRHCPRRGGSGTLCTLPELWSRGAPRVNAEPTARRTWPVWVGLGLYAAARLALLPADPEVVPGFSHDSNYIAIVANNLLAGRGYVNDALWLVFLQPEQLPMPFHNANPLLPTAVAGVVWATGQSAAWAGLAVSAVSSA